MIHEGACFPPGDCAICDDRQEGLEIVRLRAELAARERVLKRMRRERDQAQLQLSQAKRALLPGMRR